MMRAVLIKDGTGPAENLYIGEVPKPQITPRQILVKVKAFGLNRMDISQREGRYPPPAGASPILGVEFSGIISEIGSEITEWAVGDHVLGLTGGGAYAEYVVACTTHLIKKPDFINWAQAASIPEAYLTAYQALVIIGKIQKGENVLIHAGASGVGVAAAQLARFFRASTVTCTTSTPEKIKWLLKMPNSSTHVANYKIDDFADVVLEITGGKGVNVVIDFVGQSHFNKNLKALAVDGRMTMLSLLSGPIVEQADLAPLLFKRLHVEGSTLRSRSHEYQADLIKRFTSNVFHHITGDTGHGAIRTYVHKVYPWEQIQDAHKEIEADRNFGKIIAEIA